MSDEPAFVPRFVVEVLTRTGKVCESFASYADARRCVDALPAESLLGIPFIFEDLPDGSQRLVREDGKPLQWHRLPDDRPAGPDEPLPLAEQDLPDDGLDDEPLPLA
jgi:hypothetical protein